VVGDRTGGGERVTEATMTNGSLTEVLDTAANAPAPALLRTLRDRGRERFESLGLPSRRQEAWRFTRLKDVEETEFVPPSMVAQRIDASPWRRADAHALVFVDGLFSPDFSRIGDLPDGVVLTNLLLATAADSEVVKKHLGSLASLDDHPFAALNTAVLADGAVIHVPAGVEVERPIQLLFVAGPKDLPTVCAPRILIVAGEGSSVTVEEHHVGAEGKALSCPVTEIVIEAGAVVRHVIIQDESQTTQHLASRHVVLGPRSRYAAQAVSLGGALARTDIHVSLDGEDAEAHLDGLYLTASSQQADSHLTVRHRSPNCRSHQLYKGILGGSSRAVFTGRIVVEQDAQKTDATQSNRNLILSDDAVAHSNPQLEILADDVRCTHGSTVGRLDDDAVFYLRSRGIGREEARKLLTLAFAGEVLDRIPVEALRDALIGRVSEKLAVIERSGNAA
jgi:Fe-S cluster assembly protein SufD